jgi:hypothetical protein
MGGGDLIGRDGRSGEKCEERNSAILIDDSNETRDASEVDKGSGEIADCDANVAKKRHWPGESGESNTVCGEASVRDSKTQDEGQKDCHDHHHTSCTEGSDWDRVCRLREQVS